MVSVSKIQRYPTDCFKLFFSYLWLNSTQFKWLKSLQNSQICGELQKLCQRNLTKKKFSLRHPGNQIWIKCSAVLGNHRSWNTVSNCWILGSSTCNSIFMVGMKIYFRNRAENFMKFVIQLVLVVIHWVIY